MMVLSLWLKILAISESWQNWKLRYAVIIRHFCILLTMRMLSFEADVYIKTLTGANKSKACLPNNRNPVIKSWWVLREKCLPAAIAQLGWNKQCERKTWHSSQVIYECDHIKKVGLFFAACDTGILQHLWLLLRRCQHHDSLAPLDVCPENVRG